MPITLKELLAEDTPRHKVFISFHNDDMEYKKRFEKTFGEYLDGFVSKAVGDGDINPDLPTETIRQQIRDKFIADASVTIVLVGKNTWKRKHVDWEISSSIRDTKNNSRTGLIGILLPTYCPPLLYASYGDGLITKDGVSYNPYNIPPRLHDNIQCGFASLYSWPTSAYDLKQWIHLAYKNRKIINPDNSYPLFAKNRSNDLESWR